VIVDGVAARLRVRLHCSGRVGDGSGHVGIGLGKAKEVPEAIRKAVEHAKKELILVPIKDYTVPCENSGQSTGSPFSAPEAAPDSLTG
jgi:small subunit ribosomal protein S5